MAATFLTDGLTMFSLLVNVRLTLDEITSEKAKTMKRVGYIMAISFMLCYIPPSIIVHHKPNFEIWMKISVNISILVTNTCILIYLKSKLKKFGAQFT